MKNKKYTIEVSDEIDNKAYGVDIKTTIQFDNVKDVESFSFWARANHMSVKVKKHKSDYKISEAEASMRNMLLKWWKKDIRYE